MGGGAAVEGVRGFILLSICLAFQFAALWVRMLVVDEKVLEKNRTEPPGPPDKSTPVSTLSESSSINLMFFTNHCGSPHWIFFHQESKSEKACTIAEIKPTPLLLLPWWLGCA